MCQLIFKANLRLLGLLVYSKYLYSSGIGKKLQGNIPFFIIEVIVELIIYFFAVVCLQFILL